MNIFDSIERNFFLKEIFPNGIKENILLGHIELRSDKAISICIHTKQKPEKEIKKWGVWGINYNTIVIEILLSSIDKVEITDWQNIEPCPILCSCENNVFSILFSGTNWHVLFKMKTLIFQQCSVYIDSNGLDVD